MNEEPRCSVTKTIRPKRWPYDEYYIGKKDEEGRKVGEAENHWTGAESIEWYTGRMVRDTMHGYGEYRWRYKHSACKFVTYEGMFFANKMHGYGVMSYPDGRVFSGLYYQDVRWGPGEERTLKGSNVGLWHGTRLVRLAWKPPVPSIAPDLTSGPTGNAFVEPHRKLLLKNTEIIGQNNKMIDLLMQYGADSYTAARLWPELYPAYCTEQNSLLFDKDFFQKEYYGSEIHSLVDIDKNVKVSDESVGEMEEEAVDAGPRHVFYSWNNNEMMVHMMKHSYQHDHQRSHMTPLKLEQILNGPRKLFKSAGRHEYDSRTLLMACYLGHIIQVMGLINEADVLPSISDMQGNSAFMYAVCGDQLEVCKFLLEAGVGIDCVNDSCCTPLGVTLMRYVSYYHRISPGDMVYAFVPPAEPQTLEPEEAQKLDQPKDWYINRKDSEYSDKSGKSSMNVIQKIERKSDLKRKPSTRFSRTNVAPFSSNPSKSSEPDRDQDAEFTEEKRTYLNINTEYVTRVNELFADQKNSNANIFLFGVPDITEDVIKRDAKDKLEDPENLMNARQKSTPSVKKSAKASSPTMKSKKSDISAAKLTKSVENFKPDETIISKIEKTIEFLIANGADPKNVHCPYSALLLATKTMSPDIVQLMVANGSQINEKSTEKPGYTLLDGLLCEPFTNGNLAMIKTLLDLGADVNHRLPFKEKGLDDRYIEVPGPDLLTVVLSKHVEPHTEDICTEVVKALLEKNCNPYVLFKGQSIIDRVMMSDLQLLDIFITHTKHGLNKEINKQHQTILVKFFSNSFFAKQPQKEKLAILTHLLLYGADPFIKCRDGEATYGNLFVYATLILSEQRPFSPSFTRIEAAAAAGAGRPGKSKMKVAKPEKPPVPLPKPKVEKPDGNKKPKPVNLYDDYKEAMILMTEYCRLLQVRWLQAQLVKELIDIICRYQHRPWNMILKEYTNGKTIALWLTPLRCLEIWQLFQNTRINKYKSDKVLKQLLCIVQFHKHRLGLSTHVFLIDSKKETSNHVNSRMTASEKTLIESDVGCLLKEHKTVVQLSSVSEKREDYVLPELEFKCGNKYKVCFECSLPLRENSFQCDICRMVSYCNMDCLEINLQREHCHPCSQLLLEKYFPPSIEEPSEIGAHSTIHNNSLSGAVGASELKSLNKIMSKKSYNKSRSKTSKIINDENKSTASYKDN